MKIKIIKNLFLMCLLNLGYFAALGQKILFKLDNPGQKTLTVAFNESSDILATAGMNNEITLWDVKSGNKLNVLKGHTDYVICLTFSDDGKFLVSGSKDKTAIIWNLNGGVAFRNLKGHTASVMSVAFSPDNRYVVTGSNDHSLKIWDVNTENSLRTLSGHEDNVLGVTFHPNGKWVASTGMDKTLRIWEINKGQNLQTLKLANVGRTVNYSPNGMMLATAGDDKKIKLWDAENYKEIKSFAGHKGWVNHLMFSADSRFIVSGSHDFHVKVWDIQAGIEKFTLKEQNNYVTSVALSPDGNYLAASDLGDQVKIWDVSTLGIQPTDNPVVVNRNKGNEGDKKTTKVSGDLEFDVAKQSENYLLLVGISRYESWPPLTNAIKDAQDVKNVLLDRYNFKGENVIEVYDKEATSEGIFKALQKVKQKITGNDNLLIYFSGHGHYDAEYKEGYWVPVDARQNKTTDYFPNSTLLKYLGAIDTKHTFLVADACFSGSLFSDQHRGYIENVEAIKSRWGLTSGLLEFVSDGVAGENSPFAHYFIKFLKENKKNKFTVNELVQYVKEAVANNSEQQPIGNPLKGVGHEGGEFVFYLKK